MEDVQEVHFDKTLDGCHEHGCPRSLQLRKQEDSDGFVAEAELGGRLEPKFLAVSQRVAARFDLHRIGHQTMTENQKKHDLGQKSPVQTKMTLRGHP